MRTVLSADESASAVVNAMDREGYAVVEGLLSPMQIDAAAEAVDALMAQPPEQYKWIRQRTYEQFETFPIFVDLIVHPLVVQVARAWCGEGMHLIAAQCSRNARDEPYFEGVENLHQDRVFFPKEPARNMMPWRTGFTAMWYVQDTPIEMGPTQVVPRSHLHQGDEPPTRTRRISHAMAAGSLLLFAHATWHSGALNHTDTPRDLISNAYARPEVDKVQLTTPTGDGDRYIKPDALLSLGDPALNQLLG